MSAATKRLWVIDPSINHPEDQGVGNVIGDWAGDTRVFRTALSPGDGPGPDTGYAVDAVVLLGSASSVHDGLPWWGPLAEWLTPILEGDVRVPLLGICFGHQMMAHCAGGEVGFVTPDRTKFVSVDTSQLRGVRFLPGSHDLRVVGSHNEEVQRLPVGYQAVARRGSSELDGMQHASLPLWSFQFHPEAGTDFARSAGLDPAELDARQQADSKRLLKAFRKIAE